MEPLQAWIIGCFCGAAAVTLVLLGIVEEGYFSPETIERWYTRSRWRARRPETAEPPSDETSEPKK